MTVSVLTHSSSAQKPGGMGAFTIITGSLQEDEEEKINLKHERAYY
jgi:hypothetical protein